MHLKTKQLLEQFLHRMDIQLPMNQRSSTLTRKTTQSTTRKCVQLCMHLIAGDPFSSKDISKSTSTIAPSYTSKLNRISTNAKFDGWNEQRIMTAKSSINLEKKTL